MTDKFTITAFTSKAAMLRYRLEERLLTCLINLHACNKLDAYVVDNLSVLTGINAVKLCKTHGIVYTIPKDYPDSGAHRW